MHRVEQFTLGRVWDGLTDEELFWEPVPGAWGIRRRGDSLTPQPFGDGEWVADFDVDADTSGHPAMTTIGWLLWHVGSMPGRLVETEVFGGPHAYSSGWTSPYLTHHPRFTTADSAVEELRRGWSALRSAVEEADDARLEAHHPRYLYARGEASDGLLPLGPPGPKHPAVFFVAGVINEVSHHGTQICVLRDLFAARH
jgi:hypothetical protein